MGVWWYCNFEARSAFENGWCTVIRRMPPSSSVRAHREPSRTLSCSLINRCSTKLRTYARSLGDVVTGRLVVRCRTAVEGGQSVPPRVTVLPSALATLQRTAFVVAAVVDSGEAVEAGLACSRVGKRSWCQTRLPTGCCRCKSSLVRIYRTCLYSFHPDWLGRKEG